jgi:uncharacterized protein (TIGR00288 family)
MTAQFARTPPRGRPAGGTIHEPHAALLIDFDNVTMGIRSDLTKELKNLLNSDIIKGKVAVQRAYADWRRYPQYIVPLAESSVDLIFAPAYGSAKKNATDIRLAIDAVELVFTRPEIGTIILLSGDSDFSSLVLKLKEYGKYVIGVGIRESASDLLVQNCDEYYSYSALTGLTRAGEEGPAVSDDPWELVEMALRQMIDNNDVMRSDRLKQVLIEMDPGFDEKALGFQKFNKFVQEAATRGVISLRKQENGQYELGPPGPEAVEAAAAAARGEGRETRSRRGRRGRGRRDEPRQSRDEAEGQLELEGEDGPETPDAADSAAGLTAPAAQPAEAAAPDAVDSAAAEADAAAESAPAEVAAAADEPAVETRRPRRGRGRKTAAPAAEDTPAPDAADAAGEPVAAAAAPAASLPGAAQAGEGLPAAYDLLRRAVSEMVRKSGPAVRDSDVKRRMLELQPGWDESAVGFSKFSRFLRQAHDAQVVTLRKSENGNDVLLGDGGVHLEESREERGGRDRGRGRGRDHGAPPSRGEDSAVAGAAAAGATQATPAAEHQPEQKLAAQQSVQSPAGKPAAKAAAEAASPAAAPAAGAAMGFRRGSRGRGTPSGPPPLLEGQTVGRAVKAAPAASSEPALSQESAASAGKSEEQPAAKPAAGRPARKAARAPAKKSPAAGKTPDRKPGRPPEAAKKGGRPSTKLEPGAFGLPTGAAEVTEYLSSNYKGVGPKSVESLIEGVGPARVFDVLENQPDRVRELVTGARGERLLEAWADDIAFRRANAAPTSASTAKAAPAGGARRGGKGGPARGAGAGKSAAGGKGGKGGRPPRRGAPSRK